MSHTCGWVSVPLPCPCRIRCSVLLGRSAICHHRCQPWTPRLLPSLSYPLPSPSLQDISNVMSFALESCLMSKAWDLPSSAGAEPSAPLKSRDELLFIMPLTSCEIRSDELIPLLPRRPPSAPLSPLLSPRFALYIVSRVAYINTDLPPRFLLNLDWFISQSEQQELVPPALWSSYLKPIYIYRHCCF